MLCENIHRCAHKYYKYARLYNLCIHRAAYFIHCEKHGNKAEQKRIEIRRNTEHAEYKVMYCKPYILSGNKNHAQQKHGYGEPNHRK